MTNQDYYMQDSGAGVGVFFFFKVITASKEFIIYPIRMMKDTQNDVRILAKGKR